MRSHYCGHLNESHIDQTVTLCGWVHRRRDHGGVIFLDLRDREGIAQVVIDPDTEEAFALAERVRSEFVLKLTGRVRIRPEGTRNPEMPTGMIEVKHLRMEYGDTVALENLTLHVPQGEVFGLIGPNGAGKTTLIRILATLLEPTYGEVRIAGVDALEDPFRLYRCHTIMNCTKTCP